MKASISVPDASLTGSVTVVIKYRILYFPAQRRSVQIKYNVMLTAIIMSQMLLLVIFNVERIIKVCIMHSFKQQTR